MIPSISLGNDSLGLGQMFAGSIGALTSATGTTECGAKPTCIPINKTCKDKNKFYNECRMKALEVQDNANRLKSASASASSVFTTKNIVIGAALIAVLIVILILIFK